jgi:hypothetical protein
VNLRLVASVPARRWLIPNQFWPVPSPLLVKSKQIDTAVSD